MRFRFNADHDQMNILVGFSKFEPCFQTGMTHLNNLIRKWNVYPYQNMDILGE